MKIIVISIIPEIIESYVNYGVIKKAIDRKIIDIEVINVRQFSEDSYIDDKPYGGGAGMIIKVEPLVGNSALFLLSLDRTWDKLIPLVF